MTRVSVVKEGHFTMRGLDEIDEAEIFEGAENTLTMAQTYTWEFQCQYELQTYPFDKQVHISNHNSRLVFFFSISGVQNGDGCGERGQ